MLSIVCWRWGTHYGVEYVNRLRSMLSRHLCLPHQLFCVTDDPGGLDDGITPIPIWPSDGLGRCRRLRIFDPSMRSLFGDRILQLDIDGIIVGDITPLLDRQEPLLMWRSPPEIKLASGEFKPNSEDGIGAYNTSLVLMDTGVMPTIWNDYLRCPQEIELAAMKGGFGTVIRKSYKGVVTAVRRLEPGDDDQAVVSLYAKPLNPPIWTEADGVYKWGRRGFSERDKLPENARIIFFNGSLPHRTFGQQDWIKEHWC